MLNYFAILLFQPQPRATPVVPARTMPHYPLTSSAGGMKVSLQPTVGVMLKTVPTTSVMPAATMPKMKTTTMVPTTNKPIVITKPAVVQPVTKTTVPVSKTQVFELSLIHVHSLA